MLWRLRYRLREFVTGSIWPIPAAIVIFAAFLLDLTGPVDRIMAGQQGDIAEVGPVFSESTATALMSAIAGAMITFTGFVFTVLLLVVQFGSSQFTPRVLRIAYRDRLTQVTLGVFVGTFVFALTVLGEVDEEVPTFSVSVAILLVLLSVILFIALVSRTASRMRATRIADAVARDGLRAIRAAFRPLADAHADAGTEPTAPRGPPDAEVALERGGYLQAMHVRALVRLARRRGVEIRLRRAVGDYVTPRSPLFEVRGGAVLARALRKAVVVREERATSHDPVFAIRVLADIANKALSPGVNDPTTAIQTIDRMEVLLEEIAGRELPRGRWRDRDGAVRLRVPTPTWRDLLELAIGEIHQYGRRSIQVTRRLRAVLVSLLEITPPGERREAVRAQLSRIDRMTPSEFPDELDRSEAAAADWQGLGLAREAPPLAGEEVGSPESG